MMPQHDEQLTELSALYALGGLTDAEVAEVQAHLATGCECCRREYASAYVSLGAVSRSADAPPPADLRERVLAKIRQAPKARTVVPLWRSPNAWAGAAVATAAVIAAVVVIGRGLFAPSEQSWAGACTPAAACSSARVVAVGSDWLRLEVSGLAAAPTGKVYQTWVIHKGGKPLPEPLFGAQPDGSARVMIPAGAGPGMVIAVTIEPAGGSNSPTTKPFLIATLN